MLVEYQEAVRFYEAFPTIYRLPHLHPAYITIDALRESNRLPEFFIYQEKDNFYYHGYIKTPIGKANLVDHESAYGYGGPVANTKNIKFLNAAWAAYSQHCVTTNTLAEFIRFHPILENSIFYQGNIINNRETVWIDLQDNYEANYKDRAQRKIRALEKKGIRVEWIKSSAFHNFFIDTYSHHMRRLSADNFYLFNKKYLSSLLLWDKANFAIALRDDVPLGAGIFLMDGYICDYHLGATTDEGHSIGVLNVLFHEAAQYAQKCGARVLHLGGGRTSNPNDSLLFFKAGFSNKRSHFRTGSAIWKPEDLDDLKSNFIEKNGHQPERVLFYR